MSIFEALMLLAFGASWPFSIAKSLRTRQVAGQSAIFLCIVFLGYLSGIVHKLLFSRDWIMVLYITNACMVAFDLMLYLRFSRKE
jgi:hypothetical protein